MSSVISEENQEVLKDVYRVNIQVARPDGEKIHFQIKKTTVLLKLMTAYCNREGLNLGDVRFVFDGKRIKKTDTPAELEMEEDDCIEVYQYQSGGF